MTKSLQDEISELIIVRDFLEGEFKKETNMNIQDISDKTILSKRAKSLLDSYNEINGKIK